MDLTDGYCLYLNKVVYDKMTSIQQGALLNTIVCDNKETVHNAMKQICSVYPMQCTELLKQYKLNQRCVSNPVTQSEKCICDPDSFALYCEILKAKQHISKTIKVNCERPFGNKDQQFRALMENFDRDYMDDFGQLLARISASKFDLNLQMPTWPREARNYSRDWYDMTCGLNVETHRLFAEMKKIDIGFCLLDDQLKKAGKTSHPYSFCNQ
ncbi:hypothetical protein PRIPAC_75088 [Pristionchus pacificus]|uniref:Uncharacterized protein n=1 Tax=Pristionchus pacificus TaxID=54126 RepID=A0A2A6C062_PRIPA|nr:hypothetical protein PRIPAC_75088 [Pristionchus pacificus]|eukprot:PDM71403.1 hypothetical protein PRIPAC_37810 [Pristionchus pacificus]